MSRPANTVIHKKVPRWVSAALIAGVLLLVMWIVGSSTPSAGGPLIGKPAPVIEGKTVSGETFRLSDHKGKVVLVNFWATWCGPCRMEIPDLIALQKEYEGRGLVVVGLSTDDSMEPVLPYAAQAGINYPVLLATAPLGQAFGGVPSLPTTFLIGRNGAIVSMYEGLTSREMLEKDIKELLR